eukprot:358836-Chlamydomonas_euryale.AAC.3
MKASAGPTANTPHLDASLDAALKTLITPKRALLAPPLCPSDTRAHDGMHTCHHSLGCDFVWDLGPPPPLTPSHTRRAREASSAVGRVLQLNPRKQALHSGASRMFIADKPRTVLEVAQYLCKSERGKIRQPNPGQAFVGSNNGKR